MKKIFILILFTNIFSTSFSQNDVENMIKYWHYRERLKYFIVPGIKQGESEVISTRNRMDDYYNNPTPPYTYKNSDIGQHGVYFGYYLSVLATEYRLLSDNYRTAEANNTLAELNLALDQFINYMDECEYYWNETNTVDGFFVRENVPCDFLDTNAANGISTTGKKHLDLLNKDLTPYNVWDDTNKTFRGLTRGHPGYSDFINAQMCSDSEDKKPPMSQDEAIGVLQGLALISKLCPSYEANRSKDIACNIVTYIKNSYAAHGPLPWQIYTPIWGQTDGGGTGFSWFFAYPFEKVANKISSGCTTYEVGYPGELSWQAQKYIRIGPIFNQSMAATLAAMSKSWNIGITIKIGCCISWCPPYTCLQIPIKIPATGWGIKNSTKVNNNETFYLLLYEVLQNKSTSYLEQSKALTQLNSAPCEGPYDYGDDIHPQNDIYGGWSSSYRWRDYIYEQQGGNGVKGNYNGLAYMAFYNLYHLIYGGTLYENYDSRFLTGTVSNPQNYVAFDTLFSIQAITNSQPIVNYKAGELVNLKPGFHAFTGSDFHAYIQKTNCGDNNIVSDTSSQSSIYPLDEDTLILTDTIPCVSGHDTLHLNGIDEDTTKTLFTYHWNFGPNAIFIPNADVYNPDVVLPDCNSLYRCQVTIVDSAGDTNTFSFNLFKLCCDSSKALWNLSEKNPLFKDYPFFVFPNPTTGLFTVRYSDINDIYTVEIFDITGNCIYRKENITGETELDLSSEPKGVYFVKAVTANNKMFLRKLLVN